VLTDTGFANTVMAQQMFGGHGYIAEHGMEQFVRDARIAQIYEGANGIQALDLVGRKLGKDGGRALMAFINEVGSFIKEKSGDDGMKPLVTPLGVSLGHMQQASMWFMQNAMAKPDNAGAAATESVGAYQLEGLGVQLFDSVDGDYFTVLGLPLLAALDFLRRYGCLLS